MPQTTKQVKRLIGFIQFFKNFIPNLGKKLIPFYQMLRKDAKIEATEEHYKNLEILKNDLVEATKMSLRLPKPGLQYVLLCDASYYEAGFVLMVEDYVEEPNAKSKKTFAPVAFGSHLFNTAQLKFSIYYKEFLVLYYALDHFAHYLWCSSHPIMVLTDNKSLTQFFQSKTIPPTLWNFLDRVLSFNLVIAHIPGRANYAADFLSRMQTDRSAKMSLKLTDKIPIKEVHIDTTAQIPDVMVNLISWNEDDFDTTERKFIEQLRMCGLFDQYVEQTKNEVGTDIKGFLQLKKPEINEVHYNNPLDVLSDITDRMQPLNLYSEQQQDEDIRKIIRWKKDNVTADLTYECKTVRKYFKQINRLVVEEGVLFRLFYDDIGQIQYKQYCLPKQLWKEVVYRLHNSRTAGHVGILKTIREFRQRFYFPGFSEYLIDFIRNCLTCLQLKPADERQLKPPLQPVSSLQSFPGDMLQIDLVGTFNSPIYKYVLSGIDVFSKYLFAVPLTNGSADTVAKELVKIFFNHSYLPHTIVSDLGSTFVSELLQELAELLEIKLKHASLKHPQSIGAVEGSHGPLKRILKINK